jgi:DNA-binding FrmR family transcriptional regulator
MSSHRRADPAIQAAFPGNHGWFWRNRGVAPVALTLRTSGTYRAFERKVWREPMFVARRFLPSVGNPHIYRTNTMRRPINRVGGYTMAHLTNDPAKLVARIRRLQGQLDAVARSLENKTPCGDVLQLVASIRGAVNGLTIELIEEHVRNHVVDPDHEDDPEKAKGTADLIAVLRTYLK